MLRRDCFLIHNDARAPAIARRRVDEVLSESPRTVVDVVILLVSELATNCIRYVENDFTLSIEQSAHTVRVDVVDADADGSRVRMQRPGPEQVTGRGLRIVDELADEWGVSPVENGDGKTVWFTLQVP